MQIWFKGDIQPLHVLRRACQNQEPQGFSSHFDAKKAKAPAADLSSSRGAGSSGSDLPAGAGPYKILQGVKRPLPWTSRKMAGDLLGRCLAQLLKKELSCSG